MINVQQRILNVMKKIEFSDTEIQNKATRSVLSELKTKYIDYKEAMTAETQYKLLSKMKADRLTSISVYEKANRFDLSIVEKEEANVIQKLLDELQDELPKMMTEDEIKKIITDTIAGVERPNIGMIMKAFKDIKNVDKKLVSDIAKTLIEKL